MSALKYRYQTLEFGDIDLHVRTLKDLLQFSDPDGKAAALGISDALWARSGYIWDAGYVLAHLMRDFNFGDRRILEIGCGIGLASLILNHRGAKITATDYHPDVEATLNYNAALNGDSAIPFFRAGWGDVPERAPEGSVSFELIIASDVLYEAYRVAELAQFINRNAADCCEVLIVDPGRGQRGRFSKHMTALGYEHTREKITDLPACCPEFSGHTLRFSREKTR